MTKQNDHYHAEGLKLHFDTFKHLTTLSTGSIVIMSVFLEKLIMQPEWKALVIVSLSGFILSIIGAVLTMMVFAAAYQKGGEANDFEVYLGLRGVATSAVGFLLGIIALTVFIIRNL